MNIAQLAVDNIDHFGEYTSTWFDDEQSTNIERYARSCQLADVLRSHGVEPGDRVVITMLNSPDVISAFVAVWKIGAVIIPVTPMWNARELGYVLEDSGACVAMTSPELASRVIEASRGVATCREVLTFGPNDAGAVDISPVIEDAIPYEPLVTRKPGDMAMLLYTSGTTGHPKGVVLSHENMMFASQALEQNLQGINPPCGVSVLPLSHVYGVLVMNLGFRIGSRSRILRHWDSKQVFEAIEELRVDRLSVVPTMLSYMINFPERDQYDLSSLVRVTSGGAPLSEAVRLDFERIFDCSVVQGYGLSETAGVLTSYKHTDDYRVGSVGQPLPGVEMCVMDMQGGALPAGQTGELCARGPHIMQGYFNKPEATSETIVDGWLHTGDVGHIDENGCVFITDRKKDLIIKGGENISPTEIEEGLYSHSAVAEAAVFGVPDETFGEQIVAAVVLKHGQSATPEEILEHAKSYVTKFKVPAEIRVLESLPKNPTGKILKRALRDQFMGQG